MYYGLMNATYANPGVDARERLLASAQKLFAEQGVEATSPRQVLQDSGVGQGSLYHHFPTKHDLAQAAIDLTAAASLDNARASLMGEGAPLERLTKYLTRPRDAVAGCRVGRLTSDATVMASEDLQRPVNDYFVALIDLVTDVLLDHGVTPESARDQAITAVAVLQGGYVLSRAVGDPELMRSAVAGLLALIEEP